MSSLTTTTQRAELQAQLRIPLDALRAALESIAEALHSEHAHRDVVERGITHTVALTRRVQDLIDEIAPREASSVEAAL